jgi:hypothetical protein
MTGARRSRRMGRAAAGRFMMRSSERAGCMWTRCDVNASSPKRRPKRRLNVNDRWAPVPAQPTARLGRASPLTPRPRQIELELAAARERNDDEDAPKLDLDTLLGGRERSVGIGIEIGEGPSTKRVEVRPHASRRRRMPVALADTLGADGPTCFRADGRRVC